MKSLILRIAAAMAVLVSLIGGSTTTASAHHRIDPGPASYVITFTNLTDGQPMTPPVVALHDRRASVWNPWHRASEAVEAIAEGGDNAPLLARLAGSDLVQDFAQAGAGPFGPGESVSVTLTSDDGYARLSSINMLICTNDGFAGLDSVRLPSDGSRTYRVIAWDAGTEKNTNRAGDVPPAPPCAALPAGGGGDQDLLTQNRPILPHFGLYNGGPLNFHIFERVLEVTITRVAN